MINNKSFITIDPARADSDEFDYKHETQDYYIFEYDGCTVKCGGK